MIAESVLLFTQKEKGQGLVEYALILVLIALIVILAMSFLGPIIGNLFNNIGTSLEDPGGQGLFWTITVTPTP